MKFGFHLCLGLFAVAIQCPIDRLAVDRIHNPSRSVGIPPDPRSPFSHLAVLLRITLAESGAIMRPSQPASQSALYSGRRSTDEFTGPGRVRTSTTHGSAGGSARSREQPARHCPPTPMRRGTWKMGWRLVKIGRSRSDPSPRPNRWAVVTPGCVDGERSKRALTVLICLVHHRVRLSRLVHPFASRECW